LHDGICDTKVSISAPPHREVVASPILWSYRSEVADLVSWTLQGPSLTGHLRSPIGEQDSRSSVEAGH